MSSMSQGKNGRLPRYTKNVLEFTPNFIRVDADELTYPLHVILRYRLEQSLLSGDLSVKELPLAWNDMFMKSLALGQQMIGTGVCKIFTGTMELLAISLRIH